MIRARQRAQGKSEILRMNASHSFDREVGDDVAVSNLDADVAAGNECALSGTPDLRETVRSFCASIRFRLSWSLPS